MMLLSNTLGRERYQMILEILKNIQEVNMLIYNETRYGMVVIQPTDVYDHALHFEHSHFPFPVQR